MSSQPTETASAIQEERSLVDYLPYAEEKDGVFIHVDGSLGRILELTPFESETAPEAKLEEWSSSVAGMISRFPAVLHGQIILYANSDIDGMMGVYTQAGCQELQEPAGIEHVVTDAKTDHFFSGRDGFVSRDKESFRVRRLRVFLSVRYFPKEVPVSFWQKKQFLFNDRRAIGTLLEESLKKARDHFCTLYTSLESQLSALQLSFQVMDKNALADVLYRLLNPRRARSIPKAALNNESLREQVVYHAPEVLGKGMILDGQHMRVITVKDLPPLTAVGMFSRHVGQGEGACFLDTLHDCMMAVNFSVPDQPSELERLKMQKVFALIRRKSSMGDVSEEAAEKKEELSTVISDLFRGGKAVVRGRIHLVLWAEQEEAAERMSDGVLAQLHRLGIGAIKEEIIAASIFLSCLPLNYDQKFDAFFRRTRRLLSDNFADLLPLYGAFQGTSTPACMYVNRRGTPVFVDFFDSDTNPHGVIIGASGAGKSFLTNDLIYQNNRLGAYFFVLDRGHSYRKTCEVLGGHYVSFDMHNPVTMNPFFRKPTAENLAFLIEILALMASGGDERDRLTREDKGFLQLAVTETYVRGKDSEVVLSDVILVLRDAAFALQHGVAPDVGSRLALRLAPFTGQGQYGKFFDGPNNFRQDSRFTVFELANLSAYPDLQVVVLLNVMFFVTQFASSPEFLGKRKFLLIDEAWQLLRTANTTEFVTAAFKTFRKYRCSTVAITQEVSDLVRQESGLAILANTANKIFLKQEPSVIDRLKAELSLPEETCAVLRSLKTVKGSYSEALVTTPSSSGVIRLVPDPFLYWAASSEPKDNEFLSQRKKEEGDLLKAIIRCAKEYPHGLR